MTVDTGTRTAGHLDALLARHDRDALCGLTPEERRRQLDARTVLLRHLERLCGQLSQAAPATAEQIAAYDAAADLRDPAFALALNAQQADIASRRIPRALAKPAGNRLSGVDM